jgi:hypothetical protein
MTTNLWTLTEADRRCPSTAKLTEAFGLDQILTVDHPDAHLWDPKSRFAAFQGVTIVESRYAGDQILQLGPRTIVLSSDHLLHRARVRRLVRDAMRRAAPDLYAYIGEA